MFALVWPLSAAYSWHRAENTLGLPSSVVEAPDHPWLALVLHTDDWIGASFCVSANAHTIHVMRCAHVFQ